MDRITRDRLMALKPGASILVSGTLRDELVRVRSVIKRIHVKHKDMRFSCKIRDRAYSSYTFMVTRIS